MSTVRLRGVTWDHERGIGGLQAASSAYRAVRPEISVEWTARSLQAFADQPLDELARDFDLLYVDHPAIGSAVASGSLVPLDEHLDRDVQQDQLANSVGRSAESYVWEGHTWALATDAAAQVAAYRPDLLDRAGVGVPRTWDTVMEATDALETHGLRVAMPSIPVDAICAFLALCGGFGDVPFDQRVGVVSADAGRCALELLMRVVARAHPSSLEWNPPRMLEHMSSEDDVAYCPLAFGYVNYARPGFRRHVVRFAAPPAGADATPRGTLGGAGLAVSSYGANAEEAVRYAAFVAGAETQRGPYFDGGGQPGHRAAWTDARLNARSSGFFADTLPALDVAYLRPRFDGFLSFQDAAGRAVHQFLVDGADPGATLRRLDQALDDALTGTPR